MEGIKKEQKEKRKEDAQEIQKMESRMYENKFPHIDDLVMCLIRTTFEDGAYVELLEYNNIKGMILSSEMSRKRVKYVKKLVKEGREEVLRVLRVDPQQGYIDLSKKSVQSDEIEDFKEMYYQSKKVHEIMKIFAFKVRADLEKLYAQIGWPLYKLYGHAYTAFKEALNDEEAVFSKIDIDEKYRKELMEILKVRMVPKPVKIRADFKLTCFKFEGIEAIKAALQEGERLSTNEIPIKFRVLGSPIYECSTETINKAEGLKLVGQALKVVETSIRLREGNFLLQTKPTILGEAAEKGIQEQMLQIQKKESEIDEEESDEDHQEGIVADIEDDALKDDDLKLTAKKKGDDSDEDDV